MAKIYQEQKTYLDSETGEVVSLESRIVRTIKPDDFMQIYLSDLSGLLSLESAAEYKILIAIWQKVNFNAENSSSGNEIILIKSVKETIAKEAGISYSRLNNLLPLLVQKELLIKKDRSIYILNPTYFFKGYVKDRFNVIKTIFEYHIEK